MTDIFMELSDGTEVRVAGNYVPGTRGARDSLGVPEEPDDPPDFEIVEVRDAMGQAITLGEADLERAITLGIEEAENDFYNYSPCKEPT